MRQSTFINCVSNNDTKDFGRNGVFFINTSFASSRTSGIDLLFIVERSLFMGSVGTSLAILTETDNNIIINESHFISNYGSPITICDTWDYGVSHVMIEDSNFLYNECITYSILISVGKRSIIIVNNVTMKSNAGSGVIRSVNGTLKIHQSRFLENKGPLAVLVIIEVSIIELQDSRFESNHETAILSGNLFEPPNFKSIVILNTEFINCSAPHGGGAIDISDEESYVTLAVKNSIFVDNFALSNDDGFGGAVYLSLAPDTEIQPGCNIDQELSLSKRSEESNEFPSWAYNSNVTFEDTVFERNAGAIGGAVYIANGKVSFRNCSFVDNAAAIQGGHIYTRAGTASLDVQECIFRQNRLPLQNASYNKASFIQTESSGVFKLFNTTMNVTLFGRSGLLLLVRNGRLIDLGNNDLTIFNCPVGTKIQIVNFTDNVTVLVNSTSCKVEVTTLEFSCSACEGNFYSLQRGRAVGSQVLPGFQCLPCPFGANCSQNIIAKPNFWGFKEKVSPPTLKFTMCPLGYCRPPNKVDFPEYNGCHSNRSGELCGQCSVTYSETLYSTNCKPSHDCNDYWFWPVALVYVLVMALYFICMLPIISWIKSQILWFKKNEAANEEESFDRGYLKILFYFYQAANLVLVSNTSQRIVKTEFADIVVGLFNFQQKLSSSGLICPFSGMTVVTKRLFSTAYVFGTCHMIGIIYSINLGIQKCRGREAPPIGPYIAGILQTMLLGYTTLASVSFDLLQCVPVGSEERLFYDGNVECFRWWQYILIAFVCAFFVPFVFVLFWGCFKLYSRTLSGAKMLLSCCFPLPCLLYWVFIALTARGRNAGSEESLALINVANEDVSSSQVKSNPVERVLYDSFKRPEDGGKLALSWESVMIGRRLILVVLRAFVSDPLPRLLIINLVSYLFLHHHAMTQPFRDSFANTVETISLLSLTVLAITNVYFASFFSLAVTSDQFDRFSFWWKFCQVVEVVILGAVPTLFCFFAVAAVLSQVCRLIFVVGRYLCHLFRICFSWCSRNHHNDESRPLRPAT